MRSLFTAFLLIGVSPIAAFAQEVAKVAPPTAQLPNEADEDENEEEELRSGVDASGEIVVVAGRIKGEVQTPQQPVAVFDEEEIAAYGAASIDELLEAISPQTGSGRGRGEGRPVILLNGQRISSFREMRSIPPEAIRRMQVLPEEVALRFGYPPNQRVVNIILKDKYQSKQASGEFNYPTRGGYSNYEVEAGTFRIDGQRRTTIEAKITDTSLLTEAERNVIQDPATVPTVAGDPDPARNRSLAAASRVITLGGTSAMGLGKDGLGGSLTVNGAYTRTDTRSLSGLDTVRLTAPDGSTALRSLDDPLRTRVASDAFQAGLAYNRPLGSWQLTGTLDAGYTEATTKVDRRLTSDQLAGLRNAAAAGTLAVAGPLPSLADNGFDTARSKDLTASSLVTVAGNLLRLPAGEAAATVRAGFDYSRSDNRDTRNDLGAFVLDRSDASAGVNLSLPLTSKRENVLGAVGDWTLNLSGGLDHLSDFGTLTDWSAGLTWNPTSKLSFQASYIVNEAAPSLSQLGSPNVLSYNVSTYDFTRGETALVTIVSGGNPDLIAEKQRDIKLSVNWQLPPIASFLERSNVVVEYFRNRSSDVTQSFPLLTPAIEAAFPGRVTRDASGRLVTIDRRPVTFDEIASSRMRWGLNFGGRLGSAEAQGGGRGGRGGPMGMLGQALGPGAGGPPPPPPPSGGSNASGGGGGRGGPGGGFGGGPGGPGGRGGRWNIAVYHTWRFTDTVRIAPGSAELDQLDGNAIGAGGVPRHAIEFEGGLFKNGYGLRLQGEWNAPARVNGSGLPGSSDLRFGSTFDLSLRAFVNLGQQESLVQKVPFLKNARLSFTVDNLLDQRQRVTDENGQVPLAYQAAYRQPQGRVVGIDFRKMF
ncbi:hypothetical protein HNO88_003461 [Novosphingobium chloroacetimidivorans]|uniref:TonB-dependent receptor n=1 Tax=Novosphingobium chloroacetimidivorans TaxID=1428314 RepID=A0A7W7NYD5_9SPHN|nr:TonB-dependent receptor [Novosphingobium chloroacetimidivorans]MBB4860120.1 hypothetical protein [Novosphingobium chloroacetimidivorans]